MSILTLKVNTLCKPANSRQFWEWINIIFNRVDEQRLNDFGPDRTCSEWLLRNGAAVKFVGSTKFLRDYNALPPENEKFHIKEVDATESSIMHYGFPHFKGCKHIDYVLLDKCSYLQDWALPMLSYLKGSLQFLQVSSCGNITEKGLRELKVLKNLKTLLLFDLPYVKDKDAIVTELKAHLPNCSVTYKIDFNQ